MNPRELFGKDYDIFILKDPFNPHNEVEGYISRKSNEYYGALVITAINGRKVPEQLIMATPKMHYPFDTRADGSRNYAFPSAKEIEIYEKLDGTNILAYFYTDGDNRYLTYKTRLRPFLSSSKFGDFETMWREMLERQGETEIKREMIRSMCNLSFELYGSRNPHLIVYNNALDIALLFGVTNTGRILSPTNLKNPDLPIVSRMKIINKDYVWNYEETQHELQATLKQEEEGYYSGVEGTVWYLHTNDGRCLQYKCKPETIESIHFSAGARGLSKNIVIATCWNAFENTDSPTPDFIKQLLLEEFKPEIIEDNLIDTCLNFVKSEADFRNKVLEAYKDIGDNILLNKRDVMRGLASKFPRERMGKVYSIIMSYA